MLGKISILIQTLIDIMCRLDFVGQTEDTDRVAAKKNKGSKSPSLVMAIIKAYGFTFFVAGIFKLGQDLLSFISPQLLK